MGDDVDVNILKHVLIPKHTVIKDEERKELLERLGIKPNQLPKIVATGPVIKAIEAVEGDIIKIARKSPTAGTSTYYRIVIKKKDVPKR